MNDLVLVQGMADTRLALARWNRDPAPVLVPWLRLSLLIVAGLLARGLGDRRADDPRPHRLPDPGLNAPATFARLPARALPQRRSCWPCTRWPAWPASSPAARCRCRPPTAAASRAGCTSKAGPFAIGFVVCATTFSLCTQAYVIGGGAATIAAQLGVSPGAAAARPRAARDPGADGAVPAARGLDDRQPPRRLAGPAGGDGGDRRDRRAGAARERRRRDLGLAARAGRAGVLRERDGAARRPPRARQALAALRVAQAASSPPSWTRSTRRRSRP